MKRPGLIHECDHHNIISVYWSQFYIISFWPDPAGKCDHLMINLSHHLTPVYCITMVMSTLAPPRGASCEIWHLPKSLLPLADIGAVGAGRISKRGEITCRSQLLFDNPVTHHVDPLDPPMPIQQAIFNPENAQKPEFGWKKPRGGEDHEGQEKPPQHLSKINSIKHA